MSGIASLTHNIFPLVLINAKVDRESSMGTLPNALEKSGVPPTRVYSRRTAESCEGDSPQELSPDSRTPAHSTDAILPAIL
jgi:hypothetical protein